MRISKKGQRDSIYHTTKKRKTRTRLFTYAFLLFINVFVWKTERRRFEDRASVAEKKKKERRIQVFFFFFRFEEHYCVRFVVAR